MKNKSNDAARRRLQYFAKKILGKCTRGGCREFATGILCKYHREIKTIRRRKLTKIKMFLNLCTECTRPKSNGNFCEPHFLRRKKERRDRYYNNNEMEKRKQLTMKGLCNIIKCGKPLKTRWLCEYHNALHIINVKNHYYRRKDIDKRREV